MNEPKYDFLSPGAIAGIFGAILQNIYGLALKSLEVTDRVFLDFAKILVLFKHTHGPLAYIIGWTAHLAIGAVLGIIYSYMIKISTRKYYLGKGWGLGVVSWGFLLSLGSFYKVPLFTTIKPISAFVMLIGSSLWGLLTAITLKIITKNFRPYN